jgi:replication factor C subunit 1
VTITDRTVLIMDEVDGMSSGDRGGVGALNAMIKKSKVLFNFPCYHSELTRPKVPIICIANDRGAQKLKPLIQNSFSLPFQRSVDPIPSYIADAHSEQQLRPQANFIRSRIMTIAFKCVLFFFLRLSSSSFQPPEKRCRSQQM